MAEEGERRGTAVVDSDIDVAFLVPNFVDVQLPHGFLARRLRELPGIYGGFGYKLGVPHGRVLPTVLTLSLALAFDAPLALPVLQHKVGSMAGFEGVREGRVHLDPNQLLLYSF